MKLLLTGGTGFIGSHTAVELIAKKHDVVIIDNLCNSKKEVVNGIKKITGIKPIFYEGDIRDENILRKIFKKEKIDGVIHFAGLKAVGESVEKPDLYFDNNVNGFKTLLKCMDEYGVKQIIFSSSATVYGTPKTLPIKENAPVRKATNPYGQTKIDIEKLLFEKVKKDKKFNAVILRYFNPVGSHSSFVIGEDPNGIPNNLMPVVCDVACGKRKKLTIFGNNYKTRDGTCIRDYIHVVDLAKAHVAAMKKFKDKPNAYIYNLGTGKGTSVLELVKAFEKANKLKLNYEFGKRRQGDVMSCYASPLKAKKELGWSAKFNIERMCKDSYGFRLNQKKK